MPRFVQVYGSKRLDASLLLIPLVGFLPAGHPRVRGTLKAIEDNLVIDEEFVLRYAREDASDALPTGEGAFLACSFWLVDIIYCKDATRTPASFSSVCSRDAMTWVCSPRRSIR
jgi:GH15 family glucan-1,4-alpha-glucosidase